MSVEVIAEIGENHGGDILKARAMIRHAAWAGADTVKFQSYNEQCVRKDDPERDWFLQVALSDADHLRLKEVAMDSNVKLLSSPFSRERADFLVKELGLRELKIASCMMYNEVFLKHINSLVMDCGLKRVYLSTGMATLSEVQSALGWLCDVSEIVLMHCVSLYPCPENLVNLKAMERLKVSGGAESMQSYAVGYSDHTIGIDACVAAVALGAQVIEKHFTFDKKAKSGTDHVLSADEEDLAEMVKRIRKVEAMLGTGVKEPCKEEIKIKEFLKRRFIV